MSDPKNMRECLDQLAQARAVLEYIFKEIIARDEQGHFIQTFAEAFVSADWENQVILQPAATALVQKYGLDKYLPADGNLSCGHSE